MDKIKSLTEANVYNNLNLFKAYSSPIVTQVLPFVEFFAAEQNHNNYFNDHT